MGETISSGGPEGGDKKRGWQRIEAEKQEVQNEPEVQPSAPQDRPAEIKSPDSSERPGWRRVSIHQPHAAEFVDPVTGIPAPFIEMPDISVLDRDRKLAQEDDSPEIQREGADETLYLKNLADTLNRLRRTNYTGAALIGGDARFLVQAPHLSENARQALLKAREELAQNRVRFYYLPRGISLAEHLDAKKEYIANYLNITINLSPNRPDQVKTVAFTADFGILKDGVVVRKPDVAIYGDMR